MNIEQLRHKIMDSQALPYTHQIINVQKFLKDNQQFFDKLMITYHQSKNDPNLSNRRAIKSKSVSKFTITKVNNTSQTNLKERNQYLQRQIKKLRQQQAERQLQQSPQLLDKQIQMEQKSKEAETLGQINKEFKLVSEGKSDMFQMYQKMCRRCQNVRKINDEISQQLKNCIKKLNSLTGKDENPNLFIMNFK